MRRLVYSPKIKCWVKTDSGIVDLSPYITNCSINRRIDDVSQAQVEFRNPRIRTSDGKVRFMFTQHEYTNASGNTSIRPMFHPMDPITIVFERIQGKPIQVFTGYCDTTPYVQLFPGTARIVASCTLKRLKYTYWDPALDFVSSFLKEYGWDLYRDSGVSYNAQVEEQTDNNSNTSSAAKNLNDSSIGKLLYATLNEVGGWDDKNIFIQKLPNNIGSIVSNLFDEIVKDNEKINKEVGKFIDDVIGAGDFGSAIVGSNAANLNNQEVENNASGADSSDISGTEVFEGIRMASWIVPILKYARSKGWTGVVNEGFRSYALQKKYYDEYQAGLRAGPVAPPGQSNHEGAKFPRGAIDVNTTDGGHLQLNEILLNSPYRDKLKWYGYGDAPHFSHTGN